MFYKTKKRTLVIYVEKTFQIPPLGNFIPAYFFPSSAKELSKRFFAFYFFLSYDACVLSLGHHSVPVMLGLLQKFVCSMYHLGLAPPI